MNMLSLFQRQPPDLGEFLTRYGITSVNQLNNISDENWEALQKAFEGDMSGLAAWRQPQESDNPNDEAVVDMQDLQSMVGYNPNAGAAYNKQPSLNVPDAQSQMMGLLSLAKMETGRKKKQHPNLMGILAP